MRDRLLQHSIKGLLRGLAIRRREQRVTLRRTKQSPHEKVRMND